jgi:hypothetical protein
MQHTFFHILGFDDSHFSSWLDPNTGFPFFDVKKDDVIRSQGSKYLITPFIKEAARAYYNCPTLDGMLL